MNQEKKTNNAISPTRAENYPEWYQQVIKAADLAEVSPVRGCMVIKPWGYGIWERIQKLLDEKFKETGHVNAYFPLFIPKSFLEKEAKHVDGFAKECAVVTHHRLEQGPDGSLIAAGPLEEPLVIRPTSETIIGAMYAKWVKSYRDLPILINQWANVVRWEMRTRMFLRTTEFLWQEGHTAHSTENEALEETMKMLHVYGDFAENVLAMPVIRGEKTESERFPGAVRTFSIEAMMQDKKALQAGTSHFLGQNFSRAQEIQFLDEKGEQQFAWTTSWGVSTRLIGGIIMTHSDDDGLILPPRIAPQQVILFPIYRTPEEKKKVLQYCEEIKGSLKQQSFDSEPIRAQIDDRDLRGGEKVWQAIKKGYPIRLEIGPRDLEARSVFLGRRDRGPKEKESVKVEHFVQDISKILLEIQEGLLEKAKRFRDGNIQDLQSMDDLDAYFKEDGAAGFARVPLVETEEVLQFLGQRKLSIRCIPLSERGKAEKQGDGSSIRSVIVGKAY